MKVPAEIFREYDVRGVVDTDLTREVAHALGLALGTRVRATGGDVVVVGRDCRPHGEWLETELVRGINETGCKALTIGAVPTPVGYWAIQHLGAHAGVQITGSHNPPEYNGFKLTVQGASLYGPDIQALRETIERGDFARGTATCEARPVLEAYLAELQKNLRPAARPMKVVVDAGNGTGGITALPLYRALGYDVVPLFCEMDGRFPNHHPDPTVEKNLADLKKAMVLHRADVGLAFDGDADRIGVIDRAGEVVWGDRLLTLLARAVLQEEPGATIIGEVKCSKTLYDDIAKHGGKPVMWKAGHSLIKAKMKETRAALAGEMSGHIFFKHRYHGFDDAVYAGGRLLELLSATPKSIEELLADVPKTVSTPEIRYDCPERVKFELVRRVTAAFKDRAAREGFRVVDIDGARVEWADAWGLVRCSNTQPLLVLRFEAGSKARLDEVQSIVMAEIERQRQGLAP